jgi:hypothetical protein
VTVNEEVEFRVKGRNLWLRDEEGKERKMRIVKKTRKE